MTNKSNRWRDIPDHHSDGEDSVVSSDEITDEDIQKLSEAIERSPLYQKLKDSFDSGLDKLNLLLDLISSLNGKVERILNDFNKLQL